MTAPDLPAAMHRLAAACDRASDRIEAEARAREGLHVATLLAALLTACTGIRTEVRHADAR